MSNSMAIKQDTLPKGVAIAVLAFASMVALGFGATKCIQGMDLYATLSPTTIVASGMFLIICLALPMVSAGVKGKIKTTLTLGSISSVVLGAILCVAM